MKDLTIKMPPGFSDNDLQKVLDEEYGKEVKDFVIKKQSLDARRKNKIHWLLKVAIIEDESDRESLKSDLLTIPKGTGKKVCVVGSGPAGFFSAFLLQQSGYKVTLVERGSEIDKREKGIEVFEDSAEFNPKANYAFGEGGAGTFSDGKLTTRSKKGVDAYNYIISAYINAGAPPEIAYLAHPHLGSDNLRQIVKKLRQQFIDAGGEIKFETTLTELKVEKGTVKAAVTDGGDIVADYYVVAPGLAAFDTYKLLMNCGVKFRTKSFAIGHRVEHEQNIINKAQWGAEEIPGLKAAEYRLATKESGDYPVYTFCMCPGGVVVPSASFANLNTVNGMSFYARDGRFANAGVVAGIHPDDLLGRTASPMEALECLEELEEKFFYATDNFTVPFCGIRDYIKQRMPEDIPDSSYPMGMEPYALWNLLPRPIAKSIRKGLQNFGRKISGFSKGVIMGLESKTSSPIQVMRNRESLVADGFDNLFVVGEGSGWAGGIMTSGADGIKAACSIAENQ